MSVSPAAGRILRDSSLGKLPMALRGDYALLLLHDFTANQEDRDEESPKFRWTKPNTIQESAVALTIRAAETLATAINSRTPYASSTETVGDIR